MEFRSVVEGRRSVRRFLPTPVPEEHILEIIRLATHAPSAGNQQMWHFTVITNNDVKERMRQAVNAELSRLASLAAGGSEGVQFARRWSTFFADAPVVIAVSTQTYSSPVDRLLAQLGYSQTEIDNLRMRPDLQSIGAVVQTLLLAAYEKGYGTCYLTGPLVARRQLEEILGIQEPRALAAIVALGIPAESPAARPRKAVEEVVTFMR